MPQAPALKTDASSRESRFGDRGHVTLEGVCKSYTTESGPKHVVQNCSATIERGSLTVMIGPSGGGKTTLLRMIAGFEKPTAGSIRIDGRPVTGPGKDRMVVFQESALFPWMTVEENAFFGIKARGSLSPVDVVRVRAIIDRVGLREFRDKLPPQLSGGMQRRAELARALANDPALMLLDEPFRGLDAMTKALMWEYYAGLFAESRRTTLFVTTDIDEAIYLGDRLLVMTNMPVAVREIIDISLPRPRRLQDIVENNVANDVKIRALGLLHEEAMKGFARGSKAAADFVSAYARRVAGSSTTRQD